MHTTQPAYQKIRPVPKFLFAKKQNKQNKWTTFSDLFDNAKNNSELLYLSDVFEFRCCVQLPYRRSLICLESIISSEAC